MRKLLGILCMLVVACGGGDGGGNGGRTTAPELPNPDDLALVDLTIEAIDASDEAADACDTAVTGTVYVPANEDDPNLCLGELVDSSFFRRVTLGTSEVTGDEGGKYWVGLATSAALGDEGYLVVLVRNASSSIGSRCSGVDADGFGYNNVTAKDSSSELTGGRGLCGGLDHSGPGAFLLGSSDYSKVRIVLPGEEKGFDMGLTKIK